MNKKTSLTRLKNTVLYLNSKYGEGRKPLAIKILTDTVTHEDVYNELSKEQSLVDLKNEHVLSGLITRLAHVSFEETLREIPMDENEYACHGFLDNADGSFVELVIIIPTDWLKHTNQFSEVIIDEYEQGTFHPAWLVQEGE